MLTAALCVHTFRGKTSDSSPERSAELDRGQGVSVIVEMLEQRRSCVIDVAAFWQAGRWGDRSKGTSRQVLWLVDQLLNTTSSIQLAPAVLLTADSNATLQRLKGPKLVWLGARVDVPDGDVTGPRCSGLRPLCRGQCLQTPPCPKQQMVICHMAQGLPADGRKNN